MLLRLPPLPLTTFYLPPPFCPTGLVSIFICLSIQEYDALFLGLVGSILNGAGFPLLGYLISRTLNTFYTPDTRQMKHDGDMWALIFIALGIVVGLARMGQEYGLGE